MDVFAPFTLSTARLTLRFIAPGDAEDLFRIMSVDETMRYFSSTPWLQLSQAVENVEQTLKGYRDGTLLRLAMVPREGEHAGAVIGAVTLYGFDLRNRRCEIGYILDRQHWGQRYTQEAMRAVIAYAFDTLQLHRLEADIHPDNIASERLLQSLHFQREGHLRQRWFVGNEISDSLIYGLLRADWDAAIHPAQ
nr:GNAT family protein [uncultured Duganella sp.]